MRKLALLAVSILFLAGFTQLLSAESNKVELDNSVPALRYEDDEKVYHLATQHDIEKMKEEIGVRCSDKNYNVVVDGFGTGVAPPTEESWSMYENRLVIVDRLKTSGDPGITAVDLSLDPHFPGIGNQGSQGSCGAWAMTYYTYGYLEAKDQGWNQAWMYNSDHLLSPAWTYNKANWGTDGGSWMWDNGFIISDWGSATMSTMPYDQTDHLNWGDANAFREAPLHRGDQVYYMGHSASVNDIKGLINGGTPVTFVIDAYEYSSGFADGNWIISSAEYNSLTYNHAQTIVGYDDTITDDGEWGAFRVANSWGNGWADNGFFWLTYDAFLKIGGNNLLYLTYMDDIPDYVPSLLATWHFNGAPTRDIDIELGIGQYHSPLLTKSPFYNYDSGNTLPTYVSLDVTEFRSHFYNGENQFFLALGTSTGSGTISSFKLEHYETGYVRGQPTQVSLQSPDIPQTTPGYVTGFLYRYTPIDINEALDNQELTFTTGGVAGWTGVNHESSDGVDSMQSGDVGDNGISYLETTITAPVSFSWSWKISAGGGDSLVMLIDGGNFGVIGGVQDWQTLSLEFTVPNTHVIRWEFRKSSHTSLDEDAAWLDNIQTYQLHNLNLVADPRADNWNFVSFNLIPHTTSLFDILEDPIYGITGHYDRVMRYNVITGQWRTYVPGRDEHYNKLNRWDHTMGIWIRMLMTDTLTIKGTAPVSTDITLCPGWNMVGYPSSQISNMNLPAQITRVGYFDPMMPYNIAYDHDPMAYMFTPDQGYWLYNNLDIDVVWTVVY